MLLSKAGQKIDELQAQVAIQQQKIDSQHALLKEVDRGQARKVPVNPNKVFRDIYDIAAAVEEEVRRKAAAKEKAAIKVANIAAKAAIKGKGKERMTV